ncbi:TetR/AcrR family transcriptional regulator [Poritiphilus flavus]|uniref:TetR family transcriptional regulator n=1 Tax=Poritiphilus flavus TaxID=2697053 RepID=A0A6L9EB20_9FLAO|nr:TetR/AcrR family transcriptional regulator [Poritiphilus flavus]NAS11758.1 TetR family transcriptional regulator [Poritiphilus flavus]
MKPKDGKKVTAIYDATVALIGEVGLAGLRMSAIAEKAKLASGTLYIYFESKEHLLNALYSKIMMEGTIQLLPNITHLPVKKQLYVIWESVIRFRYGRNDEMIFLDQFRYSPMISEENSKLTEKFISHVEKMLDSGKEEMIVKELDNHFLIPLLYGYANDLSRYLVVRNVALTEEVITRSFGICWDAIKA